MPFFRNNCIKNQFRKEINKNVTLQVRNPPYDKRNLTAGRRVSFSASLPEPGLTSLKGGMTVEAALGLTLFLFFMALMACPIQIMDTRRRVQAGVEAQGEMIAQYGYFTTGLAESEDMDLLAGMSEAAICLMVERAAENSVDTKRAGKFSAGKSRILEDGETIDLIVDYEIKLPFPVFSLEELPQQVRCLRRAWTGKDGLRAENGDQSEGETIVYVGRDSVRYHVSRTCHYLYNHITAVSREELDSLRNQDGKRYKACAICGNGTGDTVYIMPSGESYHSRRDCRSITAYVRAVPLESVRHLGACSYCSAAGN